MLRRFPIRILAVACWCALALGADPVPSPLHEPAIPSRVMEGGIRLDRLLNAIGLQPDRGIRIELRSPSPYPPSHQPAGDFYREAVLRWDSEAALDELARAFAGVGGGREAVARKLRAAGDRRELALTEILPSFVKERVGTCAKEYGPNCWNAVLNFHYPDFGIKATPGREIQRKLDEDFQPVPAKTDVKPGDVICLYSQVWAGAAQLSRGEISFGSDGRITAPPLRSEDGIVHCAVYLGGGVVFQKHSTDEKEPYAFDSFEHAFDSYQNIRGRLVFRFYRRKE